MKATPIALLLAGVLASPLCAAGLDARLTLVEGSTDDVRVNLTLTNTGEKPVRLLKWQLPGSEDAPLFQVERDGQPVDYEGALIKRAAPSDKDYQLLKAGQSLTVQAEVSGLYDMSAQGQYSIRYLLPTVAQEGKAAKAKQAQASESNAVTLWVDGVSDDRVLAKAAVAEPQAVSASVSFSGRCTNTQKSDILAALELQQDQGCHRQQAAHLRLRLQAELLCLCLSGPALQGLSVQELLDSAGHRDRFPRRHHCPRAEPLQRGGGHRRSGIRSGQCAQSGEHGSPEGPEQCRQP